MMFLYRCRKTIWKALGTCVPCGMVEGGDGLAEEEDWNYHAILGCYSYHMEKLNAVDIG